MSETREDEFGEIEPITDEFGDIEPIGDQKEQAEPERVQPTNDEVKPVQEEAKPEPVQAEETEPASEKTEKAPKATSLAERIASGDIDDDMSGIADRKNFEDRYVTGAGGIPIKFGKRKLREYDDAAKMDDLAELATKAGVPDWQVKRVRDKAKTYDEMRGYMSAVAKYVPKQVDESGNAPERSMKYTKNLLGIPVNIVGGLTAGLLTTAGTVLGGDAGTEAPQMMDSPYAKKEGEEFESWYDRVSPKKRNEGESFSQYRRRMAERDSDESVSKAKEFFDLMAPVKGKEGMHPVYSVMNEKKEIGDRTIRQMIADHLLQSGLRLRRDLAENIPVGQTGNAFVDWMSSAATGIGSFAYGGPLMIPFSAAESYQNTKDIAIQNGLGEKEANRLGMAGAFTDGALTAAFYLAPFRRWMNGKNITPVQRINSASYSEMSGGMGKYFAKQELINQGVAAAEAGGIMGVQAGADEAINQLAQGKDVDFGDVVVSGVKGGAEGLAIGAIMGGARVLGAYAKGAETYDTLVRDLIKTPEGAARIAEFNKDGTADMLATFEKGEAVSAKQLDRAGLPPMSMEERIDYIKRLHAQGITSESIRRQAKVGGAEAEGGDGTPSANPPPAPPSVPTPGDADATSALARRIEGSFGVKPARFNAPFTRDGKPDFNAMTYRNKVTGETGTANISFDEETGISIMETSDGKFTVYDSEGNSDTADNLGDAIRKADQFALMNQYDGELRKVKEQAIVGEIQRIDPSRKAVSFNTMDEALSAIKSSIEGGGNDLGIKNLSAFVDPANGFRANSEAFITPDGTTVFILDNLENAYRVEDILGHKPKDGGIEFVSPEAEAVEQNAPAAEAKVDERKPEFKPVESVLETIADEMDMVKTEDDRKNFLSYVDEMVGKYPESNVLKQFANMARQRFASEIKAEPEAKSEPVKSEAPVQTEAVEKKESVTKPAEKRDAKPVQEDLVLDAGEVKAPKSEPPKAEETKPVERKNENAIDEYNGRLGSKTEDGRPVSPFVPGLRSGVGSTKDFRDKRLAEMGTDFEHATAEQLLKVVNEKNEIEDKYQKAVKDWYASLPDGTTVYPDDGHTGGPIMKVDGEWYELDSDGNVDHQTFDHNGEPLGNSFTVKHEIGSMTTPIPELARVEYPKNNVNSVSKPSNVETAKKTETKPVVDKDGIVSIDSDTPPMKVVGRKRNGSPILAPEGKVGDKVRTKDGTVFRVRKSKDSDNLRWVGVVSSEGVKLNDRYSAEDVEGGKVKGMFETIGELGPDQEWAVVSIGNGGRITLRPAKSEASYKVVEKPTFTANGPDARLKQYRDYLNNTDHTEASLKDAIRSVSSHARQKGASLYPKSYHDAVKSMIEDAERRVGEIKANFDRENADRLRARVADKSTFGHIQKFVNDEQFGKEHPFLSLRFGGDAGVVGRDDMQFSYDVDKDGNFVGYGSDYFESLFNGVKGAERDALKQLVFGDTGKGARTTRLGNDAVVERYREAMGDDSLTIEDIVDNIISEFDDYRQWVSDGAKTSEELHYEELERRERGMDEDEDNYYRLQAADRETYDSIRWSDEGGVVNGDGTAYNAERLANGDIMLTDRDTGDVFVVSANEPAYEEVWNERSSEVEPGGAGEAPVGDSGVRAEARAGGEEGGAGSASEGQGSEVLPGSRGGKLPSEGGRHLEDTAKDRKARSLTAEQKERRKQVAEANRILAKENPTEEEMGRVRELLDKGVEISAFDSDLFEKDDIAAWPVDGLKIETAEDVAHLGQMLSNPFFEVSKALYLDENNVVIGHFISELGTIGSVSLKSENIISHAPKGTKAVIVSHNHPTGSTAPSRQDVEVTDGLKKELAKAGIEFVDHVITDTTEFTSMSHDWDADTIAKNGGFDVSGRSGFAENGGSIQQPVDLYNVVDYGERIDTSSNGEYYNLVKNIALGLSTHDAGASYIIGTDRSAKVVSIAKIPESGEPGALDGFFKNVGRGAYRFNLIVGNRPFDRTALVDSLMRDVQRTPEGGNGRIQEVISIPLQKSLDLGRSGFGNAYDFVALPDDEVFGKQKDTVDVGKPAASNKKISREDKARNALEKSTKSKDDMKLVSDVLNDGVELRSDRFGEYSKFAHDVSSAIGQHDSGSSYLLTLDDKSNVKSICKIPEWTSRNGINDFFKTFGRGSSKFAVLAGDIPFDRLGFTESMLKYSEYDPSVTKPELEHVYSIVGMKEVVFGNKDSKQHLLEFADVPDPQVFISKKSSADGASNTVDFKETPEQKSRREFFDNLSDIEGVSFTREFDMVWLHGYSPKKIDKDSIKRMGFRWGGGRRDGYKAFGIQYGLIPDTSKIISKIDESDGATARALEADRKAYEERSGKTNARRSEERKAANDAVAAKRRESYKMTDEESKASVKELDDLDLDSMLLEPEANIVSGTWDGGIGGIYTGSASDYANKDEEGRIVNGPSLKKIGTGEGSHVYGWGLYGSTERGVAENYARQAQNEGAVLRNGKESSPYADGAEGLAVQAIIDHGSVNAAIAHLKSEEKRLGLAKKSNNPFRLAYEDMKKNKYSFGENANVYEQTFFTNRAPGDESHLLNWYEPVSKENYERIEELYKNEFGKSLYEAKVSWADESDNRRSARSSGQSMYTTLKTKLGSPKAASEFLARADIDGVKYPVDSYGKQVKDGDKAGWNYVSFRDDNIRVDHKWRDGEQLFEPERDINRPTTVLDKVFQVGIRQAANFLENGKGTKFVDFVKYADGVFGANAPKLRKFYPTWYSEAGLDVSESIREQMDGAAELDRQTREMFGLPARAKDKPGARVAYVVQEHLVPKPPEVVGEAAYNHGLDADQRVGVNLALNAISKDGGSFMIADGTGFGKTRQILAIADQFKKANPQARVLILTKNANIIADSFAKDSRAMGINVDRFTMGTYDGMRAGKFATDGDDLFEDASKWDLVLLDEAHLLSNSESGRSKAFADMNVDHVVFATATPMDRPTDAAYFLSRLVGADMNVLAKSLGYTIEKIRGVDGKERDVAYPMNGSDMESIKRAIIAERDKAIACGKMIRRAYPFLGDIDTKHNVEMSNEHIGNENDIIRYFDNEVQKLRNARRIYVRGKNGTPGKLYFKNGVPKGAYGIAVPADRWPMVVDQKRAELLQDRTRAVDDINESEKAKEAAKIAVEIMSKTPGARVIICGTQVSEHHVKGGFETDEKSMHLSGYKKSILKSGIVYDIPPSLEVAAKALAENGITKISRIHGGFDKEQEQRDFVSGKTDVLIMTDKSGGTGINLDDTTGMHPTYLLVLSPNYSAKEIDQLLGRVSRKNTKSLSHVYFLANESYSDAHRAKVTEKKLGILKAIQGGADMDALGDIGKEGSDGELSEPEVNMVRSLPTRLSDLYLGRQSNGELAEDEVSMVKSISDDESEMKAAIMMSNLMGVDEKLKAALTERGLVRRAFNGDEEARTLLFHEWDGYKLDGIIRMKARENGMTATPEDVKYIASQVWFGDSSLVAHGSGLEPKFELNRNGVFTDWNRRSEKVMKKYGDVKFITILANKADHVVKDILERKYGRTDGRTGKYRAPTGLQFTLNDMSPSRDGSEVIESLGSKSSVDAWVLANQRNADARAREQRAYFSRIAKKLPSRERSMLYAMLYAHIDVREAEENSKIGAGAKLSYSSPIGDKVARKAAEQLGYGFRVFKHNWENILAKMRKPGFRDMPDAQDSNFGKFTPSELIDMMYEENLDDMANVVELREQGMSVRGISMKLGITEGAVRTQISRAKKDWGYVEQLSLCDTVQPDLNFGVRLESDYEEPAPAKEETGRFAKKSSFVPNQPSLFDSPAPAPKKTDFAGMRQAASEMKGENMYYSMDYIESKVREQYPDASDGLVKMAVAQGVKTDARPVSDTSGRKYSSIEDMQKSIDVVRERMANSIKSMLANVDITDARLIKDALKQVYPYVGSVELEMAYDRNVVPARMNQLRKAILENRYKVGSEKELVDLVKPMFKEMTTQAVKDALKDTNTFDVFIRANREKEMMAYAKSIVDVVNDPASLESELKIRYPGASRDAIASVMNEVGTSLRLVKPKDTSGMSQGMLFEEERKATRFNNDAVDRWRIERGMDAVAPRAKYTADDLTADVRKTMTNMTEARNQIEAMLKSGRFAVDARQQGLIGAFIKSTQDQYEGLLSKRMAAENSGDMASAADFDRQMDALRPDLDRIHNLNKRVGKEWSDAGRARQMMLMDDYSFIAQRRKAEDAKGAPLTKEEERRLQALVKGVLGKNVELDEERMKQLELAVSSLVDSWMKKGVSDVSVARLSRDERTIEREYAEALRQFDFHRDRLGGVLVNLPNGKKWLNAVQRHYLFNGEAYVDGKPDQKKMVSLILRDLADHGIFATDWQVRQMLTEMGHSTIPPQSRIEKDRRDLNAQHRIEQQIAYIMKFNELPPVTGYQRDEESQAVRMLKKMRSNVIKEKGLDAENEAGRLKSSLDRAKKTIRNKMADLEDAIRRNERIVKEKRTRNEDAELADLRTQYAAVKEAYDRAFPPTASEELESAVVRTIGGLKRMRKFWQDRLDAAKATGDFDRADPKGPTREDVRAANPDVARYEAEIESIKAEFENLKETMFPDGTAKEIARREEARLRAMDTRLKELEKQENDYLRANTYADKANALKGKERKDPWMTPAMAVKKAEIERAKAKIESFRRELKRQNMQLGDKALSFMADLAGASRLIRTSCDLGQILIQGGLMTTRHPVLGVNAAIDSVRALSPRQNDLIEQGLKNDLYFDDFVNMGGHVYGGLDRAEQFRGMDDSIVMKVPGISHAISASERSFSTYLNVFALSMYKNIVRGAWANGQPTDAQRRQIASAVNTAMGYGYDSKSGSGAVGAMAGILMFAPRLFVANAKMAFFVDTLKQLTGIGTGESREEYGRKDRLEVAKKVGSEQIGAIVSAAAVSAALMMLFDEDKDKMSNDWFVRHFVPGQRDFMKTNRENSFHISVGFQKVARFYNIVGRMVSHLLGGDDTQKRASEKAIGREIRKTMSPVAGTVWDVLAKEDFLGRALNWSKLSMHDPNDMRAESEKEPDERGISGVLHLVENLAVPMTFVDYYDALRYEGVKGAAYYPLILTGAQMTMYKDNPVTDASFGSQDFNKQMKSASESGDREKVGRLAEVGRERGKAMGMAKGVKGMESQLNGLVRQEETIGKMVDSGIATDELVKRRENLRRGIANLRKKLLEIRPKAEEESRKVNWKKSLE